MQKNRIYQVTITCGIISLVGSLDFRRGDPAANGPVPPLRMEDFGDKGAPDALLGDRGGVLPDENNEGIFDPENVVFPIPGTDKDTPALASSSSDKTCMYRSLFTIMFYALISYKHICNIIVIRPFQNLSSRSSYFHKVKLPMDRPYNQ